MKKFLSLFVICVCVLVNLINVDVFCESVWQNDGTDMGSGDACYGDSGFPSSFKNVKYYDVAIPYKLKLEDDIGGCASGGNGKMADSTKRATAGSLIARETSRSYALTHYPALRKATFDVATANGWDNGSDDLGMAYVKDKNGTTYYLMAIQEYFYKYTGVKKFPGWNSIGGQIVDVILTDGTVIHFIIYDANASHHTNGGDSDGSKDWFTSFTELKIKYYRNLFAAANGNCPEVLADDNSSIGKFRAKFKLDKKVRIAYYRMYNKRYADSPEPANEVVKSVAYNDGKSVMSIEGSTSANVGARTSSSEKNKQLNASFVNGAYTESQLGAFQTLAEADIQAQYLDLVNPDEFTLSEDEALTNWQANISSEATDKSLISYVRVFVQIIGILFTVWVILIYVCFWFDRLNNFIDFPLLPLITLGKLEASVSDDDCAGMGEPVNGKRPVGHRGIVYLCIVSIVFGVLIISGTMFEILSLLIRAVKGILGGSV